MTTASRLRSWSSGQAIRGGIRRRRSGSLAVAQPGWRNGRREWSQTPLSERTCGFKSHTRHQSASVSSREAAVAGRFRSRVRQRRCRCSARMVSRLPERLGSPQLGVSRPDPCGACAISGSLGAGTDTLAGDARAARPALRRDRLADARARVRGTAATFRSRDVARFVQGERSVIESSTERCSALEPGSAPALAVLELVTPSGR